MFNYRCLSLMASEGESLGWTDAQRQCSVLN